ncbi:hypothetical protein ACLOJK_015075, partial [Asimina triloba]
TEGVPQSSQTSSGMQFNPCTTAMNLSLNRAIMVNHGWKFEFGSTHFSLAHPYTTAKNLVEDSSQQASFPVAMGRQFGALV